jgi:hypothetical protein
MNTPFDPETSAVEKMLHDRTQQTLSPALRSRVLTAVDEVLHDDRLIRRGEHGSEFQWLAVGGLMATALSLLILATLASEAASRRIGGTTEQPLLSFAQRAEAAGITLDVIPPSAVQVASGLPRDTAIPRHSEPFHVLDTRSFLQGDL